MNTKRTEIDCKSNYPLTNRKELFTIIVYSFDYNSSSDDKAVLDRLIAKGLALAEKVNPGAANNSTHKREFERIKNNCIAGVIAEYCWLYFLNDKGTQKRVSETPYTDASNQIDLQVLKNKNTIEVRSSFPRGAIPFVLCHPTYEFDVIGPYQNNYKPSEVQKHFYVRTLFRMDNPNELLTKVYQNGFEVNLTGGATWAMMANDKVAKYKSFIPDDEVSLARIATKSSYRVVPFSNALDTIAIYDIIKSL